VYPEGVIKYRCASRGYTAWWQRKLYFTFLTAYILVIPAVFMTFCYVKVVLVVWRRSKELSAKTTSNTPTIQTHEEQTENVPMDETGSRHRAEAISPARSHSDAGYRRFCRFRRVTTGAERAAEISLQSHSPEADEFSTGTGSRSSKPPSRLLFATGSRHPFRRSATVSECTTDTSSQMRSLEADEFSAAAGNRSTTSSSAASPRLRRAAFNVAAMSRARVRTVQMTLCIVLSFIACWAPYFTVHLIHIWSEYQRQIPEMVYVFAETLALVNSAVNPLLYAFFNSSVSCWRCRRRPADRPLAFVDLRKGRSQANIFGSSSVDDRGRTWPRPASGSSTWLGHSVDGRRLASVGGNFLGVTGFNGRGMSSAPRSCDL